MAAAEMVAVINTAMQAVIDSGHTLPMTDSRIVAAQAVLATIQQAEKISEVPQQSVTYNVDGAHITITFDAAHGVYWASLAGEDAPATAPQGAFERNTARFAQITTESAELGLTPAQAWERLWDITLDDAQQRVGN